MITPGAAGTLRLRGGDRGDLPAHLEGCKVVSFGLTGCLAAPPDTPHFFPPSTRRDISRYGHCSFTIPFGVLVQALQGMLPPGERVCFSQPITQTYQQERCHIIRVFGSADPAHDAASPEGTQWVTSWDVTLDAPWNHGKLSYSRWEQLEFAFVLPEGQEYLSFPAADTEVQAVERVYPVTPRGSGGRVSLAEARKQIVEALVRYVCNTKETAPDEHVQMPGSFRGLFFEKNLRAQLEKQTGYSWDLTDRAVVLLGVQDPHDDANRDAVYEAFMDLVQWVDRE